MMWFKSKTEHDLKILLKKSREAFRFDQKPTKIRLMASIEQFEHHPIKTFQFSRVLKFSGSFAGFVLIVAASFAFASNQTPGDKLYALNKAGENVILNIPMPAEQRAQVRGYFVEQRFQALDSVELPETKKLETIKESDESLMRAVDEITKSKKNFESKGKTRQADKLEGILDELQKNALEREKIIQKLEDETDDVDMKREIRKHLDQIKNSREKARLEIKRFKQDTSPTRSESPS